MAKLTNFVFHSSLAIAIIFNIVAVGRAKAEDVNNFGALQGAIGNDGKNYLNVKQDIPFTNEIAINRSNLTISGPGGGEVKLDGSEQHRFFTIGENLENISLKNLHFNGGHDNRLGLISGNSNSEAGGGAIHLKRGTKIILENTTFNKNQAGLFGGAIRSRGAEDRKNTLELKGKTIFNGNESTENDSEGGGAIYGEYSNMIFGEVIFEKNKSYGCGGAIYVLNYVVMTFGEKATFSDNESSNGTGGAICAYDHSSLTFGGEAIFTENSSVGNGGAIFSSGENATNKNILKFEGNASFVRNSATEGGNGNGGAIFVENSSLTFGGLATFENNRAR
ncbi:MAG: hypothetical protein LBB13_02550, partial [Rickettsiales bacterium]|nr:hypothetical protein [Rickettsiales bacterium]